MAGKRMKDRVHSVGLRMSKGMADMEERGGTCRQKKEGKKS